MKRPSSFNPTQGEPSGSKECATIFSESFETQDEKEEEERVSLIEKDFSVAK